VTATAALEETASRQQHWQFKQQHCDSNSITASLCQQQQTIAPHQRSFFIAFLKAKSQPKI
jgi:hypothetical protein